MALVRVTDGALDERDRHLRFDEFERIGRCVAGPAGDLGRELLRELTGERQWAYEQP